MFPYQERVIREQKELSDKTELLGAFINSSAMLPLDLDEQTRLVRQYWIMCAYCKVLDERIAAFGRQ